MEVVAGLQETPQDKRDFQLGQVFDLPELTELPSAFEHEPFSVKTQIDDFCTAAATCGMSELQEETELSYKYSMALSKELSGNPDAWGQNLRTAMKTHVTYGAIGIDSSPFSTNEDGKFLRHIDNWPPGLKELAEIHKKQSYFTVTGPYDHYDNIRAAIWKFRKQKRGVGIGVIWGWPLSNAEITEVKEHGVGHMVYVIGWNERGLVIQNSYGVDVGDHGKFYMSREVVNAGVGRYGAYMFIDMPKDVAQHRNEIACKSYLGCLFKSIYNYIKSLIT